MWVVFSYITIVKETYIALIFAMKMQSQKDNVHHPLLFKWKINTLKPYAHCAPVPITKSYTNVPSLGNTPPSSLLSPCGVDELG